MRYFQYICFFLLSFLHFCIRNFFFFSLCFCVGIFYFFLSSVLLFSPVLVGDCFSGDFGAFVGDTFLPRVTWVHPSPFSSLLLGWSPVSLFGVFVVTGVVAGIVAFEVGVVCHCCCYWWCCYCCVVIIGGFLRAGSIKVAQLFTIASIGAFCRRPLPSSLGPYNQVYGVLPQTPPLFRHMVKE